MKNAIEMTIDKLDNYDELYTQATLKVLKNFSNWMIKEGYWIRRSEMISRNLIDLTSAVEVPDDIPAQVRESCLPSFRMTDDLQEWVNGSWYRIIPPFEKGAIKVNKCCWIGFEVESVNEADQSFEVGVESYAFDNGVYFREGLCSGKVVFDPSSKTSIKVCVTGFDFATEIKNGFAEAIYLNDYLSTLTDDTERKLLHNEFSKLAELANPDFPMDLLQHFIGAILITNHQLYLSKPKAIRQKPVNHVRYVEGEVDPKHKQIVRAVGPNIVIRSVKMPKLADETLIRHYHVAAWNARGHVRTYKSGKQVYVRPSVHHRKCMVNQPQLIPQTIIKVGKEST